MSPGLRHTARALLLCCLLEPWANALAGEGVGSVQLIDQDGADFRLSSLHGSVALLLFGFTHCPHICPLEMSRLTAALQTLEGRGQEVKAIFITVDPQRDSPAVIKKYLSHFHPAIVGLTGTPGNLATVTDYYRVKRVQLPTAQGSYLVDHGNSLYLLNSQGEPEALVPPGLPASHIVTLVEAVQAAER